MLLVHFLLMDLNVANQSMLKINSNSRVEIDPLGKLGDVTQVPHLVQVEEVFVWHLFQ